MSQDLFSRLWKPTHKDFLLNFDTSIPFDFLECSVAVWKNPEGVQVDSFFIAPNLSFDFYKIKTPAQVQLDDFSSLAHTTPKTGFITIDKSGLITPVERLKEETTSNAVGIWVTGL